MKLVATSSLLAAVAIARPGNEILIADEKVNGVCNNDGKLVLTIPYDIPNSEVIHFKAGACTIDTVGGHVFSQDATTATLTVDINACDASFPTGSKTREDPDHSQAHQARSHDGDDDHTNWPHVAGYFTLTVEIELGRKDGDFVYSYYKATSNTECGTEQDYEVTYDYSEIDHQTHSDGLMAGTYNKYPFQVVQYSDATYATKKVDKSDRAGETVYLAVEPVAALDEDYTFAVSGCTITNTDQTDVAAVNLFSSLNDGDTCKNDFVDLAVSYDKTAQKWKMEHKLFVFGNGSKSKYQLTCAVRLCEARVDDSKCVAYNTRCGI